MMAALSHVLVEMLGTASAPLLSLVEMDDARLRVPWLGRRRSAGAPAFSAGLEGIEEDAVEIFLSEEAEPVPGEPGDFRAPHLDEGGFRPGMHAFVRPAAPLLGHALAAAAAVAIAQEAGGVIVDGAGLWVVPSGPTAAYLPEEFLAALRTNRRYASVADGAAALMARCPATGRREAPAG